MPAVAEITLLYAIYGEIKNSWTHKRNFEETSKLTDGVWVIFWMCYRGFGSEAVRRKLWNLIRKGVLIVNYTGLYKKSFLVNSANWFTRTTHRSYFSHLKIIVYPRLSYCFADGSPLSWYASTAVGHHWKWVSKSPEANCFYKDKRRNNEKRGTG